jgi:hypothetical protein
VDKINAMESACGVQAVALGLLVILFLSKSMFSFQELMMDTIVKVMDLDLLRRLKETG